MELQVKDYELPEKVLFNYKELKNELIEKTNHYKNLVVTEEIIAEAKQDKTNLNKLKKTLNDERIRREKEYMKPFNEFKQQIKELCDIIDEPVKNIDEQLKKFDDERKEKKRAEIEKQYTTIGFPDYASFEKVFNLKWLNTTYKMKDIKEELIQKCLEFSKAEHTIKQLESFSFEAMEIYKKTLNLTEAINEGQRLADMQKRKAEFQKQKAQQLAEFTAEVEKKEAEQESKQEEIELKKPEEPVQVEPKTEPKVEKWIGFEALLTTENAKKLRDFFIKNDIKFRRPQ